MAFGNRYSLQTETAFDSQEAEIALDRAAHSLARTGDYQPREIRPTTGLMP
jgi:hypothetical protein